MSGDNEEDFTVQYNAYLQRIADRKSGAEALREANAVRDVARADAAEIQRKAAGRTVNRAFAGVVSRFPRPFPRATTGPGAAAGAGLLARSYAARSMSGSQFVPVRRRCSFSPIIFENGGQTTFHQSWLPGYHFDIGGDTNPPRNAFALWWMLREAYRQGLPLEHIQCRDGRNRWTHHSKLKTKIG